MTAERLAVRDVVLRAAAIATRRRPRRLGSAAVLAATLGIFTVFVTVGSLAPAIAPYNPDKQSLVRRLEPPVWQRGGSWEHPLGADHLGRDVLSRLIHGTRVSLIVVVTAIPLSLVAGTLLGLVAGYYLGLADKAIMRVVDVQLALPGLLFAVLFASVFGPSLRNVVVVLAVFGWSGFARVVRGEVLRMRERDFITAARVLGAGDGRILARHILPNVVNAVVVLATLDIAAVILAEASLSFLGVGVPPTQASWGGMVAQGRNYMAVSWWLVTIPGLAILVMSLAGNFLGDWLRDFLDPRLKHTR